MALNIHTDKDFEKCLGWLSRKLGKTKTDLIKDLVMERYQTSKNAFQFGALKKSSKSSSSSIQNRLKKLDKDHDLDR